MQAVARGTDGWRRLMVEPCQPDEAADIVRADGWQTVVAAAVVYPCSRSRLRGAGWPGAMTRCHLDGAEDPVAARAAAVARIASSRCVVLGQEVPTPVAPVVPPGVLQTCGQAPSSAMCAFCGAPARRGP